MTVSQASNVSSFRDAVTNFASDAAFGFYMPGADNNERALETGVALTMMCVGAFYTATMRPETLIVLPMLAGSFFPILSSWASDGRNARLALDMK